MIHYYKGNNITPDKNLKFVHVPCTPVILNSVNFTESVRGSNPGGGEVFHTCPDQPWGLPSLLYNGYQVFPGGKVLPGHDADPSPPYSAEFKNRVELYFYSP